MTERRQLIIPRTPREIALAIAPWLGLYVALMLVQFAMVVLLNEISVLRLTENALSVYLRFGDIRTVDGTFSVLTLVLTAVGVGACVLTATLPHLRADDRHFAWAIGIQFTLLGVEEQLQLHRWFGDSEWGDVAGLGLHVIIALAIFTKWRLRVLRVWPLIVIGGGSLGMAIVLDLFESETLWVRYLEEWLELLGAVFLAGIAISLARQAIIDASRSRRFAHPS